MTTQRIATLTLGVLGLFLAGNLLHGQGTMPRQSYGPWTYHKEKNYHYRVFQYKAQPTDTAYRQEYVIYYKNDPKVNNKWVYFYNPTTEKFWGRYPTTHHDTYGKGAKAGQELWSVLPPAARHKDIYQVDLKKFPEPNPKVCPPIPGANDNTPLLAPPSDLP